MRRCPCPLIRLVDVTTWDPAPFRDQVQAVLDAFLDERGAELAALGPDATRLIAEIEGMPRERYAGPVGWMDASGDGEWGIALRSAMVTEAGVLRA